MRSPRPDAFDPTLSKRKPEMVNMSGVVPLQSKPTFPTKDKTVTVLESRRDGMTARQHDSMKSRYQAIRTASHQDSMAAEKPFNVQQLLKEKATQKSTVRLPAELLQKLEETLYLIKRQHNTRLSMNAVLVAALASFCAEFDELGTDSPLYKLLKENQS